MPLFAFPSQVNEPAARLVGAVVATSLVVAIATDAGFVLPILALGFALRVGWGPRFSLLGRGAVALAKRAFVARPVAGAPKQFAQGIGLVCTAGATTLLAAGLPAQAWALAAVVALFATLEATLGFCAGCFVFRQLQGLGVFPADACTDCVPLAGREPAR